MVTPFEGIYRHGACTQIHPSTHQLSLHSFEFSHHSILYPFPVFEYPAQQKCPLSGWFSKDIPSHMVSLPHTPAWAVEGHVQSEHSSKTLGLLIGLSELVGSAFTLPKSTSTQIINLNHFLLVFTSERFQRLQKVSPKDLIKNALAIWLKSCFFGFFHSHLPKS